MKTSFKIFRFREVQSGVFESNMPVLEALKILNGFSKEVLPDLEFLAYKDALLYLNTLIDKSQQREEYIILPVYSKEFNI